MLRKIKKAIGYLKGVGKEYILLFVVIICLGLLISSKICISQPTPLQIHLSANYPSPAGYYREISARRVIDYDFCSAAGGTMYYLDPSGISTIYNLVMNSALKTTVMTGTDTPPLYSVDFNTGDARFANLSCKGRIHMLAATPPPTGLGGMPIGGKHIYDISEGILAKGCEPGDVVLLSLDTECFLTKSLRKFDPLVIGVISEEPKICLGAGANQLPLALVGIVKCKVNTENGPIKKGDLLVTSSEPGYAMRAQIEEVKTGMVIGKALQPLEQGKDKIYILVNKQ